MDIRTRLIFALVAMSLASMAALGAFAYSTVGDLLRDNQLAKLEAVAASKEQDLTRVLVAWRDRVRLVTSRTQLRILLGKLSQNGDGESDYRKGLARILEDARQAVPALVGIQLYSRHGEPVASAGTLPEGLAPTQEDLAAAQAEGLHRDAVADPDQRLLVSYLAPMNLVDRRIGSAWVVLSASELSAVTGDYTGLGHTGEALIVRAEGPGVATSLTPLRHDGDAALHRRVEARDGVVQPAIEAVRGVEAMWTEGVDYRGEPVVAATRWLDEPGWGLVVKIDVAEERAAVLALRDTLWKLALSLSAFGIVAGMVLALIFARPIRELAEVAQRIGDGEWDLRVPERAEDEIGQLGMSFNQMKDELVEANRELERRLEDSGAKRPS